MDDAVEQQPTEEPQLPVPAQKKYLTAKELMAHALESVPACTPDGSRLAALIAAKNETELPNGLIDHPGLSDAFRRMASPPDWAAPMRGYLDGIISASSWSDDMEAIHSRISDLAIDSQRTIAQVGIAALAGFDFEPSKFETLAVKLSAQSLVEASLKGFAPPILAHLKSIDVLSSVAERMNADVAATGLRLAAAQNSFIKNIIDSMRVDIPRLIDLYPPCPPKAE